MATAATIDLLRVWLPGQRAGCQPWTPCLLAGTVESIAVTERELGRSSQVPADLGDQRRRRRRRARRGRPRRRLFLAVLVGLGFLLSAVGGAVAYFLPVASAALDATGQGGLPADAPGGGATPRPVGGQAPFTVLLLGSDSDAKFAKDHLLTQSMILVRVDPANKRVTMLSIPRDLWVSIATTGQKAKIDTAFANGGAAAAVRTVEQDFQVHVDHYVWIGLQGLVALVDAVGGVDVVTTNPVLDDFYPADLSGPNPYAYERIAVLPGAQHLDGIHALEYVRSRHGDIREDFGRSDRQQQVLLALRAKAKTLNAANLPDLAAALSGQFSTDMSIREVADLLPLAAGISTNDVRRILLLPPYTSGAMIDGQDVLLPDWSRILPLVHEYFPS